MRVRYARPMDPMKARALATVADFGRNVRVRRVAAGLSQIELGRRSRVTAKFIGQIELGTSNPSLVTMAFVAAALNCNVADLLPTDAVVPSVLIGTDEMARAQEALAVLGSVLTPRKNAPRPRSDWGRRRIGPAERTT